jgi:hypothetical protein
MSSLSLQIVEVKKEFDASEADTVPGVLPASQCADTQGVPAGRGRYSGIMGPVDPLALDNCAVLMSWICDNFGGPAQFLRAQLPDEANSSSLQFDVIIRSSWFLFG